MRNRGALLLAGSLLSLVVASAPVLAQEVNPDEIIVTARKRQESLLKVPVVEVVVTKQAIERYSITDITRLSAKVPGLIIGAGTSSIGTPISLRGVGTAAQDPGIDQSVSLNIDGISIGQGVAVKTGLFDLEQIEVLKGPQALFYGKSSPGGVIVLRTSDPGERFEVTTQVGYEVEAREKRAELILSGPLSETFGLRFAGRYSDMEGFFHNKATAQPGKGGVTPKYKRMSNTRSYIMRGTAVWKPSDTFKARVKANFARDNLQGDVLYTQLASCPDGIAAPAGTQFINPNDNCRIDRTNYIVDLDPTAFIGIPNNGVSYQIFRLKFGTIELDYDVVPNVTLTSVTAYIKTKTNTQINSTSAGFAGPLFSSGNIFTKRDWTQEFRANSDFSGPLNFTLGSFYQDGNLVYRFSRLGNTALGQPVLSGAQGVNYLDIKTYSLFGQLRYKPVQTLEIAAGVRWTDETRKDVVFNTTTGTPVPVPIAVPKLQAKNYSPELTISYTPTDNLTIFGSLKKGYKSGSFTTTSPPPAGSDNSFGDEKVKGGELGLKARLLDGALAVNLAGYHYKYTGLQVGLTTVVNGVSRTQTFNAGGAKVYGIDFDWTYRVPSVEGLRLNGAVNYNHARFTDLRNVPCYGGQTIAAGCNTNQAASGLFTAQVLTGARLVRAPDWQIQGGFEYEMPVGNDLSLEFGALGRYNSKFSAALSRRADTMSPATFYADGHVSLKGKDDRWEVALISNNITNKLRATNCGTSNTANGVTGGGQVTGGTGRGPAGIDEVGCNVQRGREFWLRLTVRPDRF